MDINIFDLILDTNKKLCWDDFTFDRAIGKGGFGKVWRVTRKKDNKLFAMKEMYKARVLAKRSIHSVINERKILSKLKHPFIVNMHYAF